MRIAVMGSAFNPPTLGHVDVIEQALANADRVWLVPSFRHAWGKEMAPYLDRCAMSQRLTRRAACTARRGLISPQCRCGDRRDVPCRPGTSRPAA